MDNPEEDTPEGRIIRYDAPAGDPGLSFGDPGLIDEITNHLEAFLGPVNLVWHEIVSEYAHIDVHHFASHSRSHIGEQEQRRAADFFL